MARNMAWIGPIVTLVILLGRPAALSVYWCTFAAFSIFQQLIVNHRLKHDGRTDKSIKRISKPDGLR